MKEVFKLQDKYNEIQNLKMDSLSLGIKMKQYKKDFHIGALRIQILNYEFKRFTVFKFPKRLIVDFAYWQFWFELI